MLLTDVEHPDTAGALAGKVVDRIGQPYMLSGRRIEVGVSIGVSVYPRDGTTVDTLLSRADAAMSAAKARGRRQIPVLRTRPWRGLRRAFGATRRMTHAARDRRDRGLAVPRLTSPRYSFGSGECTWVFSYSS